MTDDERLKAIEARLTAIGDAQWSYEDRSDYSTEVYINGYYVAGPSWILEMDAKSSDEAKFIAAAPDDVRWLVERVRVLSEMLRLIAPSIELWRDSLFADRPEHSFRIHDTPSQRVPPHLLDLFKSIVEADNHG